MKAHLSDGRHCWSGQPLGESDKFTLSKSGMLKISKTDLAYRITLSFSKDEMETLRDRLNEILNGKPKTKPVIMKEIEEIIKNKS